MAEVTIPVNWVAEPGKTYHAHVLNLDKGRFLDPDDPTGATWLPDRNQAKGWPLSPDKEGDPGVEGGIHALIPAEGLRDGAALKVYLFEDGKTGFIASDITTVSCGGVAIGSLLGGRLLIGR
jgi:hypothetical protein